MGKEAESSALAKALTQTLQGLGQDYQAVEAGTAHAQRTKNPSFTSDDDTTITDNTDENAVVATQTFSGVTVAQANEPSFQTAVAAAVAKVSKYTLHSNYKTRNVRTNICF